MERRKRHDVLTTDPKVEFLDMLRMSIVASAVVLGCLALAACGESVEKRAASGGMSGAAAGAVVGGPVGAVVGGVGGATTGAIIDEGVDKKVEDAAE
jgi:uncharacterized membrane protein